MNLLGNLPIVERKEAAKRKWDDPGFRAKQANSSRATMYRLKQDPEFQKKEAAARSAVFRNLWENNPEFGQKVADRSRRQCYERWQNPEFRQRHHEGLEKELERRWHDPEASPGFRKQFAETHAESTQKTWRNAKFRERIAEASRDARYRPENLNSKVHIPSIHGYRRDIGFYAQSMWEANLARVLIYGHASFSWRKTFRLTVPADYRETIGTKETDITVDFAVRDVRDRTTLYEIVAKPIAEAVKRAKLDLLRQQFPQFALIAVDPKYYEALRKEFAAKINHSRYLCGWETKQDNVRTSPAKYA